MTTTTDWNSIDSLLKLASEQEAKAGPHSPQLASTLTQLADLYFLAKDYSKAEPIYWRVLKIRQKSLGEHNPDTVATLEDMAQLYEIQDRYAEAQRFYQWATSAKKTAMLKEHEDDMESTVIMHVKPKLPPMKELEESVCPKCKRKLLDSELCLYCTQSGFDAMAYLKAVAEKQRQAEQSDQRPANMLVSEDGTEHHRLNEAEMKIGRHPSNRIVIIDDKSVSRHHATIRATGAEWFIVDNESANGTFVNGERIKQPVRILNGDCITIGNKTFKGAYTTE